MLRKGAGKPEAGSLSVLGSSLILGVQTAVDALLVWAALVDPSSPGPMLGPMLIVVALVQVVLTPLGVWTASRVQRHSPRFGRTARWVACGLGLVPIVWACAFWIEESGRVSARPAARDRPFGPDNASSVQAFRVVHGAV